jgi:diguanylate cyclase (GGDEF)-like protein
MFLKKKIIGLAAKTLLSESEILSEILSGTGSDKYTYNKADKIIREHGEDLYAKLLELFVHLPVHKDEARKYWYGIVENYRKLQAELQRDPGIRTAIVDYFDNSLKEVDKRNLLLIDLQAYHKIEELIMIDELTGCFNRRYYNLRIDEEIERSSRCSKDLSLLMIDLDDFKRFNDRRGHEFGDQVLKAFVNFLAHGTRLTDINCRWGGEEFAVLLPQTPMDVARNIAERLLKALTDEPFFVENGISFSGGIATFPEPATSADDLLRRADNGLLEAKKRGKRQIVVVQ